MTELRCRSRSMGVYNCRALPTQLIGLCKEEDFYHLYITHSTDNIGLNAITLKFFPFKLLSFKHLKLGKICRNGLVIFIPGLRKVFTRLKSDDLELNAKF